MFCTAKTYTDNVHFCDSYARSVSIYHTIYKACMGNTMEVFVEVDDFEFQENVFRRSRKQLDNDLQRLFRSRNYVTYSGKKAVLLAKTTQYRLHSNFHFTELILYAQI
jgi:hypothetical protein